jgi:hypothetical protein
MTVVYLSQMGDDDVDYVPYARFSKLEPPSTSSIENGFRIAQALERKGDPLGAVSRYLLVCDMIENVIQMNPGARVDVKWVLLALRNVADIYDSRRDWAKSKAFRACLVSFANYLKSEGQPLDDDEDPDFDSITTAAVAYGRMFTAIRDAAAIKDQPPPEEPVALLHRIAEAREKAQQERVEDMIRRLDEAHEEHEKSIKNSFWKRNLYRAARHPFIAGALMLAIAVLVVCYPAIRPAQKKQIDPDAPVDFSILDELARKNHEKAVAEGKVPRTRTPKPTRTPQPIDIDDSLFNL